ncbi:hypothetical protein T492DRAFT_833542 [Pavlovales sp. CCMP2436]|nr:hypothetical protein T492DRAFT_833542 [Pavlovales sp. CCMP2436]
MSSVRGHGAFGLLAVLAVLGLFDAMKFKLGGIALGITSHFDIALTTLMCGVAALSAEEAERNPPSAESTISCVGKDVEAGPLVFFIGLALFAAIKIKLKLDLGAPRASYNASPLRPPRAPPGPAAA